MPLEAPQKLDPSARLQLLTAISAADSENADAERLAAVFVTAAQRNGIAPDPKWLGLGLGEEAHSRGSCVKRGPSLRDAIASEFSGVPRG